MEMNKELCFIIDEKKLYLEKVLVEYNDIPIFYLCRNENEYYIVLCSDMEGETYIIVKPTRLEVLDLLHGKLSMQDIILNQKLFWKVSAGEDISQDNVETNTVDQIEYEALPYEDAFYEIPSPDMEEFVRQFENQLMTGDYKEIYENQQEIQEITAYSIQEQQDILFEESLSLEIKNLIEVIYSFERLLYISTEYRKIIPQESFSEISGTEKKIMPESVYLDFQIEDDQNDIFTAA